MFGNLCEVQAHVDRQEQNFKTTKDKQEHALLKLENNLIKLKQTNSITLHRLTEIKQDITSKQQEQGHAMNDIKDQLEKELRQATGLM